jgi:hypothetical protein
MIELSETLTDVYLNIAFDSRSDRECLILESEQYMQYVLSVGNVQLSLYENGEWNQELEPNVKAALNFIDTNLAGPANEGTKYSLRIEIDKPSSGVLQFFSYDNFINALDDDFKNSLNEVDKLSHSHESLMLFQEGKQISFGQTVKNNYNSENIFHRYNFEINPKITPEHLFKWGESLQETNPDNVFFMLSTYMSLVIFSNKAKKEDDSYHFFFNGINSVALHVNFSSDTVNILKEVHDLFRWVFEDTGAVAKISIIRNIFTTNGFSELEQAFSQETIYAIESNHQLYQEDNVKQYFEIKNKVVDFVFGLGNKMSESYDSYYNSNKVNLVAILSYIVTLVVIRGMSKGSFDSAINLFCYISLAFFIVALIYTKLVESELAKKVEFYQKQKDELYSRYKNMLCEVELNQLFSSPSYNNVKCKSEEAKFHYVVYGILVVFILIDVIVIGIRLSIP